MSTSAEESVSRIYTINFGKALLTPRYRRTDRVVNMIREFARKHMKTDEVKLDQELNRHVWKKGKANPPRRLRVKMMKGLWLFRHMRNPQRKASGQLQELTRSLIMDQNQRRSRYRRQKRRNQKNNQKLKKKNPRKREEKKIHKPRPKKASKTIFNLASMYFWTRSFRSDNSLFVDASPSSTHGPGAPETQFHYYNLVF